MSANDLLVGDLPSDDEEGDSDYITENEGSSDSEESEAEKQSFKKDLRRVRAAKRFAALMAEEEGKLESESHPDVLIDPLWLEFQQKVSPLPPCPLPDELAKYNNITKTAELVDIKKYKKLARGEIHPSTLNVDVARVGLNNAHVEVSESVRFAGKTIVLTKRVERTSADAARMEKRMQKPPSDSLDNYLYQLKNKRAVNSVEKSVADWNAVKQADEPLESGFLEKKAFLHRAEERQDDIRRESRRQLRESQQ